MISVLRNAVGSTTGIVLLLAKSVYDKVTAEIERAGKAGDSMTVGNWIKEQRNAFENALDKIIKAEVLQEQIILTYLESADRIRYFDELVDLNKSP